MAVGAAYGCCMDKQQQPGSPLVFLVTLFLVLGAVVVVMLALTPHYGWLDV